MMKNDSGVDESQRLFQNSILQHNVAVKDTKNHFLIMHKDKGLLFCFFSNVCTKYFLIASPTTQNVSQIIKTEEPCFLFRE